MAKEKANPGDIPYVDKAECTSCHLCVDEVPDVFEMDADDLAQVHNPTGAGVDEIQDSMDSCPGECIHWKQPE